MQFNLEHKKKEMGKARNLRVGFLEESNLVQDVIHLESLGSIAGGCLYHQFVVCLIFEDFLKHQSLEKKPQFKKVHPY